ncbi:hypothetical protein QE152_g14439 [Popillia japonica]|uniref:Uncharacterized protein n=1 Tax=Popillia japonica TaxID=7064 RepID=A0AAW1LAX1_POPJA
MEKLEVEPGCSKRSASPLCSEEPKIVKGDTLQSEEKTDGKTPVDKLKSRRRIVAKTPRKHRISLLREVGVGRRMALTPKDE